MKRLRLLFHPVIIFVLAQLAWLSFLGLWIYWYVTNYIIFQTVGEKLSPQLAAKGPNVVALVVGLVLLVSILFGMYLIFIYLNKQINLTKLYDNFIANVTHELKSPLASIQLYLETLKMRQIPAEKQQEFYSLMLKDASRLQNLIDTILDLSRLEKKRIAYDFQVYNATMAIEKLFAGARDQFKLPENALVLTGKPDCNIVIDWKAFKIVLDNLVDNAIKYSKDGVRISVRVNCTAENFIIEFCDRGIGIQEKDQKKIFNKFQRIYNKNVPSVKGTGLGLYWAREIIKYHGGKISVASEGENKGSTFCIELPVFHAAKKGYIKKLLELSQREKNKGDQDE